MKFVLDSLFIALVLLCVYLLYRLIQSKIAASKAKRNRYAILLPIDKNELKKGKLNIKYELPEAGLVKISLLHADESLQLQLFDSHQQEGNYVLSHDLSTIQQEAILKFETHNTKVLKRLSV